MSGVMRSAAFSGVRAMTAVAVFASVAIVTPAKADHPHSVVIGGTGTALGGMQLLAKAFVKSHPDYDVRVLPSLGSGGGIRAVSAGKIDIALSARPLKKKEQGKPITATEYARTPIVFGTRHDTKTSDVTRDQLATIYSGDTDWSDGTRLRLIMRPVGESDIKLLGGISEEVKTAVMAATKRPELFVAMNDQDNASALESTPGSFGLTTVAQVTTEERKVKLLTLDGVAGTVEGLKNKTYPYFKRLFYVTRHDTSPVIKAFIDFMRSPAGQDILVSSGHLVVDADG